jgi:hypothetical protein
MGPKARTATPLLAVLATRMTWLPFLQLSHKAAATISLGYWSWARSLAYFVAYSRHYSIYIVTRFLVFDSFHHVAVAVVIALLGHSHGHGLQY